MLIKKQKMTAVKLSGLLQDSNREYKKTAYQLLYCPSGSLDCVMILHSPPGIS